MLRAGPCIAITALCSEGWARDALPAPWTLLSMSISPARGAGGSPWRLLAKDHSKDATTGPIWTLNTLGWAVSQHQALPWALCGALGTTGCSWHQGMLHSRHSGDGGAQNTMGRQQVPTCCHPRPVNTTVLDPPPPQMSLSSLSPVPQLCPSHVPKVTRDC